MKLLNYLLINKEARLFDTVEFLFKTFVAVVIGSFVGRWVPYVSRDMISLLFGMMLTIEPVNLTGIRAGLRQLEATIIGAAITGVILAVFGYSPWTAALTVTATLYVSLLIDWRNFSVVAVFTAIYMNTYVQTDAYGDPSEIDTFMLRIAALGTGVAIAFLVNFVFSIVGYRHMLEKRLYHILDDLKGKMDQVDDMIRQGSYQGAADIMRSYPGLFNNIDWIYSTCVDFEKDPIVKRGQLTQVKLEKIMKMTSLTREMSHISYDICFRATKGDHHFGEEAFIEAFGRTLQQLDGLKDKLDQIIHNQDVNQQNGAFEESYEDVAIQHLQENIRHIDSLLMHY